MPLSDYDGLNQGAALIIMITFQSRLRRAMAITLSLWSVATLCLAAPASPPAPPPHVLITAAETLYRIKMPEACDMVIKLGLEAKDLVDSDRVQLQLLTAMRQVDAGDLTTANKAIDMALKLDRSAKLPPFATDRVRRLLEDHRALLPPPPPPPPPPRKTLFTLFSPPPTPKKVDREPVAKPLFRAMDVLYQEMHLDAADVMLDLAISEPQLTNEDRAQVLLRKGIVCMENGETGRAQTFFLRGLDADRRAKLPDYAPPKTLRAFESIRATLPPELTAPASLNQTLPKGELERREVPPPPAARPQPPNPTPMRTTAERRAAGEL